MKNNLPVQITWHPCKQSKVPVYQQIVNFVYKKISSGEWNAGTYLPAQRRMAEIFDVNRSTVVSAMEELASYGIVAGKGRMGTKIISDTWSLMLPNALDWEKYINAGVFRANKRIIRMINRFEFAPGIARISTGELDPRLFPTTMWSQVLQKVSKENFTFNYLEALGAPCLRRVIAARMQKRGMRVSAANILVTSGALQGLQLISVGLLKSNSVVYAETPGYLQSLRVFQSAGMKLRGVSMDKRGIEFWKLPANDIMKQKNKAFLYTIPTNHNPTGVTMSLSRRRELMEFCNKRQLPIIEDGAYEELCFNNIPQSLKSMDENNIVIYLGTVSKTLAPGLRVGWLVAPEPIVQRLGDVKMQMDYGTSSVSQLILLEFLNSGFYDEHIKEVKQELLIRRDNAIAVLKKYCADIASWNVPDGGFYIWMTFKNNIPIEKLFFAALQRKILFNPGKIYDLMSNNSLRVSYSYLSCREFAEAMKKFSEIIAELSIQHK
ncbi:PLP-dependent aminotransferase family protein [Pectinatus frisingensis]|uniref:aminotransferase-like domain-containing protein n=1 Tax=Pectinatus frisingensis TaxID=865 RepID=UPI0018C8588A|nr:PLP-dependent aminotransferase family protein [Pectinatus frisingensis]